MFKETNEGQTMSCSHPNSNTSGICDGCIKILAKEWDKEMEEMQPSTSNEFVEELNQAGTDEVILEKEGTLMYYFQEERTNALSEMFDNKYTDGIYPTSKFYSHLDRIVRTIISQAQNDILNERLPEATSRALEQGKREENERVGEVIQNISKSKGRPNWELELHTLEEVLTAIKQ